MSNDGNFGLFKSLLGAILDSAQTEQELIDIADSLEYNDKFRSRLVAAVRSLARPDGVPEGFLSSAHAAVQKAERMRLLEEAVSIVRHRKLGKKELIDLMRTISPKGLLTDKWVALPILDLVSHFISTEPLDRVHYFMHRIGATPPSDDYFKGLTHAR